MNFRFPLANTKYLTTVLDVFSSRTCGLFTCMLGARDKGKALFWAG